MLMYEYMQRGGATVYLHMLLHCGNTAVHASMNLSCPPWAAISNISVE